MSQIVTFITFIHIQEKKEVQLGSRVELYPPEYDKDTIICSITDPHGIVRLRFKSYCKYVIKSVSATDEGVWNITYSTNGMTNLITKNVLLTIHGNAIMLF